MRTEHKWTDLEKENANLREQLSKADLIWMQEKDKNKELKTELENLKAIHKELIEMGASMGRGYEKENKELIEALKWYASDTYMKEQLTLPYWEIGKRARETLGKLGVE